jgi:lactoylglutathione lyase
MRFLHTMIRVRDLEQSLEFYCNKLGLVETRRVENESGRFTLIFLAAAEDEAQAPTMQSPLLELTYNWDSEPAFDETRKFGHLAYQVDDIYDFCQSLVDNGVTINRPPRDGRMAFIRSPDGISIELLQKGDALEPAEPWVSMENIGHW